MNVRRLQLAFGIAFIWASIACALGPQECVILVNRRSMESMELANFYADLRRIPAVNIIHLELPDSVLGAPATMSPEDFRRYIYDPTQKVLRERNLANHALVWLYSLDFPTLIASTPPMSLTGYTFVRGNPPPAELVEKGTWKSPLFLGPDQVDGPLAKATSLENFTISLTTNMPLPNMMLGWSGSRGMSIEEIRAQLKLSATSDSALPSASVFFYENADEVRSKTRMWQFDQTTRELSSSGVAGFTVTSVPDNRPDLMGFLDGRPSIQREAYRSFRPGAYADHLTSFAGKFHEPGQTKLVEWLRMGASGSSGTVVEPGSLTIPVILWAKFPHARIFSHYAEGCTLIESLFYATRCPLQILFVGDALASPWSKPPGITLISMADDDTLPIKGKAEFLASSWAGFGQRAPTTIFFLDGRPVDLPGNKAQLELDTTRVYDGYHEIRVVAYANDVIRHQGFDVKPFLTRNRNRAVTVTGMAHRQVVDLYHPVTFHLEAEGEPREAAIIAQERVLARAPYTNGMTISVHPMLVGAGPVSFQAVVVYPDNEPVRSEPVLLEIKALNQAPIIDRITRTTNTEQEITFTLEAHDAESDTLLPIWYLDALTSTAELTFTPDENLARQSRVNETLTVASRAGVICATLPVDQPTRIKELRSKITLLEIDSIRPEHQAGIVFNYLDDKNYMFWGINGDLSAWVLVQVQDGKETTVLSRGAVLQTRTEYDVLVVSVNAQKMGFFVNHDLVAIADLAFSAGRVGVRNGTSASAYRHLFISPASAYTSGLTEKGEHLHVDPKRESLIPALHGAVRDVQLTTTRPVIE